MKSIIIKILQTIPVIFMILSGALSFAIPLRILITSAYVIDLIVAASFTDVLKWILVFILYAMITIVSIFLCALGTSLFKDIWLENKDENNRTV